MAKPAQPAYKGPVARPSAATLSRFQAPWLALIKQLTDETTAELTRIFKSSNALDEADVIERQMVELGYGVPVNVMDASLPDQAQAAINQLMARFTVLFDRAASDIVSSMIDSTFKNVQTSLAATLKFAGSDEPAKLSGQATKQLTLGPPTDDQRLIMDAASHEAASLIRRVPADYLPQVQGDVMRSITQGNGLADLEPALKERNVKIKNWAENVSKDQTRKVYNSLTSQVSQDAGAEEYEWVHSGGSNKPRKYHMDRTPEGLNGRICRYDDPPVIDERTGETGIPGQLPYCGCTQRPIFRF